MNELFKELGNKSNNSPLNQFMQNFQKFRQTVKGNPQEQVQQLLNSGKVTQQDYDNAVRIANNIKKVLGM
jgi:hypothetical protein